MKCKAAHQKINRQSSLVPVKNKTTTKGLTDERTELKQYASLFFEVEVLSRYSVDNYFFTNILSAIRNEIPLSAFLKL